MSYSFSPIQHPSTVGDFVGAAFSCRSFSVQGRVPLVASSAPVLLLQTARDLRCGFGELPV